MLRPITNLVFIVRQSFMRWLGITLMITCAYYLVILLAPMVKFRQWPNYLETYNWPENVARILRSTPSWRDSILIIKDEWVLEVGYMNYDFGIGISQWSLFLAPTKIIGIVTLGGLAASFYLCTQALRAQRPCYVVPGIKAIAGVGSLCVALASVTLSWVVCCSTPTWVVGLAIMGLGVSTSLWLEPLGPWVHFAGFALLLAAVLKVSSTLVLNPKTAHRRVMKSGEKDDYK